MKTDAEIIENLKDGGCPDPQAQEFIRCMHSGEMKKGLKIIDGCRRELLSEIHDRERKIDCLDYLVYQIKKES